MKLEWQVDTCPVWGKQLVLTVDNTYYLTTIIAKHRNKVKQQEELKQCISDLMARAVNPSRYFMC